MKNFLTLLFRRQTSVGSAALILMAMVFASRVLGLLRDRLLASFFTPDELGVYFAAFRIPNFLFELLVMGALTTAFIPVFTRYLTQGKEKDAWRMASAIINISFVFFVGISFPLIFFSEPLSRLLAPGFSQEQIQTMATYTRFIVAFQVVPLMIGNFLTGILQSYNLFLVPAMAPVVYNIGIILSIYLFSPTAGLFAPVLGVAVGAVLFMCIQIPVLLKVGYRHKLIFHPKTEGVGEVVKLIGPRTVGLAVSQIDTTVDLILASLLGAKMVTIFSFAQHLQHLPVGLFGVTVAQAALPSLSAASTRDDLTQYKNAVLSAVNQVLFFVVPVSVLFIVLRIPIVRLVFGSSRFDWQSTVLTGITLSAFSVSLFAQSITHVLVRGFYALYDSKTPVIVGIISIIINAGLSILFVVAWRYPIWALGVSTSVASILNAFFLFVLLDRRVGRFDRVKLLLPPMKMGLSALVMGIMLYVPLQILDQLVFDTTRTINLIMLTGFTGGLGLTTYFFLSWVFGVGEVHSFIALLKKVRRAGTIVLEPAKEVVNGGMQDKVT